MLGRKEVGLEELLGHRRGDAVPEPSGQRREDHRGVHVACGSRRKSPARGSTRGSPSVDVNPGEQPRDGKDPGRQARATDGARRPRSVPRRKLDRFDRCAGLAALLDDRPEGGQIRASANAFSSMCVPNASSSATISSTRSSELSPSSSIVVADVRSSRPALPRAWTAGRRRRRAAPGRRDASTPRSRRASTCRCLRCAAAPLPARPQRANLLMIGKLAVRTTDDVVDRGAGVDHEHGVHAIVLLSADDG